MTREYVPTISLTEDQCDNFSDTAQSLWKFYGHKYGGVKIILPFSRRHKHYEFNDIGSSQVNRVKQNASEIKEEGAFFKLNTPDNHCTLNFFQQKHVECVNEEDPIEWDSLDFKGPSNYAFSKINFTTNTTFDIGKIKSLLKEKKTKYPGVDSIYSYIGPKNSTSNWHSEDADLYSLNVVIVGGRKIWFFVHNEDQEEFLKLVHQLNQKECEDFLRQKKFMMTPEFLAKKGIRVHVAVQKRFEVMLTFPKGYHMVINYEYNIASATNLATPRYLSIGRNAIWTECDCKQKGRDTRKCAAKVLKDADFNLMEKYCKDNNLDYSPMVFQQDDEQEPMFLEVNIFLYRSKYFLF
jgi:hypothetical protein